ncbi:MAG: hypothetical protein ACE5GA_05300 [Candidatus Zixiibacteriota bacterium]
MGTLTIIYKLFSSVFFGASLTMLYPLAMRFFSDADKYLRNASYLGLQALTDHWEIALIAALASFVLIRKAVKMIFFISLILFVVVVALYLILPEDATSKWVTLTI